VPAGPRAHPPPGLPPLRRRRAPAYALRIAASARWASISDGKCEDQDGSVDNLSEGGVRPPSPLCDSRRGVARGICQVGPPRATHAYKLGVIHIPQFHIPEQI
jgi:hypothetical protein